MEFVLYVIAFFHRKALTIMFPSPYGAEALSEEELVEKVYKPAYRELMKPK